MRQSSNSWLPSRLFSSLYLSWGVTQLLLGIHNDQREMFREVRPCSSVPSNSSSFSASVSYQADNFRGQSPRFFIFTLNPSGGAATTREDIEISFGLLFFAQNAFATLDIVSCLSGHPHSPAICLGAEFYLWVSYFFPGKGSHHFGALQFQLVGPHSQIPHWNDFFCCLSTTGCSPLKEGAGFTAPGPATWCLTHTDQVGTTTSRANSSLSSCSLITLPSYQNSVLRNHFSHEDFCSNETE